MVGVALCVVRHRRDQRTLRGREIIRRRYFARRASSSLSGPVDPSFRALSGRLKLTVRRHRRQVQQQRQHRRKRTHSLLTEIVGSQIQRR